MLELRLLGQFEVRRDGAAVLLPSRPAQSLLAYLALSAGTAHRREKLAGLLWPDADEDNARSNLRHVLWRIRKAIEPDQVVIPYLLTDELAVSFNAGANYWLDAAVLARTGESLQDQLDTLAVYRGELLPGFYDDWVALDRERLEALFQNKMQRALDRLVEERNWAAVLEWGERWVTMGHAPEPGHRALMLAHAELGDRSGVAAVYQRCREGLFNDLGIEPSAATRRLYAQLCRDEPQPITVPEVLLSAGSTGDEAPAAGKPPFQGLHYFDEADADRFFGRESLTARLVARLRSESFVAVLGASGSGKSSVVRAGLVPALKRAYLRANGHVGSADGHAMGVGLMTPTAHPLGALVSSLLPDGGAVADRRRLLDELGRDRRGLHRFMSQYGRPSLRVLLVVDQFEEVFTACTDAFEREAFVDNLVTAADGDGPLAAVIALRADFYAHCAEYASLREAVAQHQEYVGPMSGPELRRAIEGPAEQGGWLLEPGLVSLLLRDLGEEPGALPLLSHALLETWLRRSGRRLTLRGYAESGGVQGAIAQTAETVFTQRLTRAQQLIARRVFLALTELGEGTQDTRRRAAIADLVRRPEEGPDVRAVLQILSEARLVTLAEDTTEVAHEALIREWPTLREWLNQDREGLRLERQLGAAVREWERLNRDAGLLYRGVRLAQAIEWASEHDAEINLSERAFLDASRELTEREAAERDAQRGRELQAARTLAETQRRAASQLRQRAFLLGTAFVLAFGMAAVALFFSDQAQRNAVTAQVAARIASSRELAAIAITNLDVDPERSMLLALRAVATTDPPLPEAEGALHRAVQASHLQLTLAHSDIVLSVAFSPDGTRVATLSADGVVNIWDAVTGTPLRTFSGQKPSGDRGYQALAFSPDGGRLVVGDGNLVRVLDAGSGEEVLTLRGHTHEVSAVVYSSDGGRLATADVDGMVRMWEAASGQELLRFTGHTGRIGSIAFGSDGTRLATAGWEDRTARVWEAATGRELFRLPGVGGAYLSSVAFSPDGKLLATANSLQLEAVRVWDMASGELRAEFQLPVEPISVAYSPDGTHLATANFNGTASILDATTGQQLLILHGHTAYAGAVAFSPDGRRVATASQDRTARVWDVTPDRELLTLSSDLVAINRVAYSPDGSRLATGSDNGMTRVWDAVTGKQLLTLAGPTGGIYGVAFSPDGARLATASAPPDNAAKVWNATTAEELFTLSGHTDWIRGIAYSPDGTRLATGSYDGTARVWDAATGREVRTVRGPGWVRGVAFSPDGARLAVAYRDGSVAKVWSVGTGQELFTLSGHTNALWAIAYSPDGTRIATASIDKTVRLWDAVTGHELLTLAGQAGPLWSVAFSPSGKYLAAGGADNTVKIWDVATGNQLQTLSGHISGIYGIAFSPDGTRLATASSDGTARVYALRIEELVSLARARLTRSWTLDECQQFLHLEQCPE